MGISKNGSKASVKGPEAWFTGAVRVDPLFVKREPTDEESIPAMSYGSNPAKSIGMVLRQRRP